MPEQYEYTGDISCTVIEGQRGPILRFLRDGEIVVTEIHLSRDGAKRLAAVLLGRAS
jgi:hypothetical protein